MARCLPLVEIIYLNEKIDFIKNWVNLLDGLTEIALASVKHLCVIFLFNVTAGGLGMRIVGGKSMADGSVGAYVTHVIKGGPADAQAGIRVGEYKQDSCIPA